MQSTMKTKLTFICITLATLVSAQSERFVVSLYGNVMFSSADQGLKDALRSRESDVSKARTIEMYSETWRMYCDSLWSTDLKDVEVISPRTRLTSSQRVLSLNVYSFSHGIIRGLDVSISKTSLIELYNVHGRIVHSKIFKDPLIKIPIDHLSNGIYYLVIKGENGEPLYSQKLRLS